MTAMRLPSPAAEDDAHDELGTLRTTGAGAIIDDATRGIHGSRRKRLLSARC